LPEALERRHVTISSCLTDQCIERRKVTVCRGARHQRALGHFRKGGVAAFIAQCQRGIDKRLARAALLIGTVLRTGIAVR
jgi:hypothetical protein